jgi:hypothetical protein
VPTAIPPDVLLPRKKKKAKGTKKKNLGGYEYLWAYY